MATDSTLLDSVNAGIAKVLEGIAAGKFITEFREGGVHVKKANPHELLAALRLMRAELSGGAVDRSADVGSFRGAY